MSVDNKIMHSYFASLWMPQLRIMIASSIHPKSSVSELSRRLSIFQPIFLLCKIYTIVLDISVLECPISSELTVGLYLLWIVGIFTCHV